MKKRIAFVLLLVMLAAIAGSFRGRIFGGGAGDARDESRQNFTLAQGARVEVSGINGTVEIETSDATTAEVYVLRTAHSSEALERQKISVEQTGERLVVRGEKGGWRFWRWMFGGGVTQRVALKVPRQIELSVHGVNGHVVVGEVAGNIEASGINGKLELAQADGYSSVSGVNGKVEIAIRQLGERGLSLSGVNGGIELRLGNDLNADLRASGINGKVRSEIPNVTVESDRKERNFQAHIGRGGAPITLSGINGGVRLTQFN